MSKIAEANVAVSCEPLAWVKDEQRVTKTLRFNAKTRHFI